MRTLTELLTDPAVRPRVVDACAAFVDAEVAARSGLSGLAIRTGYKAVRALKPTMIREALDALLPDFAAALEPFHAAAPGSAFEAHVRANADGAADALLGVTDRRIQRAQSSTIKKTYAGLRGLAQGQVKASVPGLARTLAAFL